MTLNEILTDFSAGDLPIDSYFFQVNSNAFAVISMLSVDGFVVVCASDCVVYVGVIVIACDFCYVVDVVANVCDHDLCIHRLDRRDRDNHHHHLHADHLHVDCWDDRTELKQLEFLVRQELSHPYHP